MRPTAVLLVIAMVLNAGPVAARQADADAWRAMAAAIEPGTFVSVRTRDGTRVRGTLVQATEGGVIVKPKTRLPTPMRTIAYTDIENMERARPGMNAGLKVVLGAGIGAGVLLLTGAILVALLAD